MPLLKSAAVRVGREGEVQRCEDVEVRTCPSQWLPACIVAQELTRRQEMEAKPQSMLDGRSKQDTAALQGSTAWATKQTVPDISFADERAVSHWSLYLGHGSKIKVKFSHTRYRALGPELIPVYRQSARR